MPHELYLIRLIHHQTGRPFPGERLWTAAQLVRVATIRFLRVRNGEGCDVYIQPYGAGISEDMPLYAEYLACGDSGLTEFGAVNRRQHLQRGWPRGSPHDFGSLLVSTLVALPHL